MGVWGWVWWGRSRSQLVKTPQKRQFTAHFTLLLFPEHRENSRDIYIYIMRELQSALAVGLEVMLQGMNISNLDDLAAALRGNGDAVAAYITSGSCRRAAFAAVQAHERQAQDAAGELLRLRVENRIFVHEIELHEEAWAHALAERAADCAKAELVSAERVAADGALAEAKAERASASRTLAEAAKTRKIAARDRTASEQAVARARAERKAAEHEIAEREQLLSKLAADKERELLDRNTTAQEEANATLAAAKEANQAARASVERKAREASAAEAARDEAAMLLARLTVNTTSVGIQTDGDVGVASEARSLADSYTPTELPIRSLEQADNFDVECPMCKGTGEIDRGFDEISCTFCDGSGIAP